jgi:hypothetical protein
MRLLHAAVLCALTTTAAIGAAQPPQLDGAFAVTEVVRFDYDRDGDRNRVQFWLEVMGRPAVGAPGEAGYQPEEGWLRYYMFDLDRDTKVFEWSIPLDMGGPPPDKTYPMENIAIEGRTARFEAFNMKWTVVDGGEGIANDTITIDDGFRSRSKTFYAGDVRVGSAPRP